MALKEISLIIQLQDEIGNVIFERVGENHLEIIIKREYQAGDKIIIKSSKWPVNLNLKISDSIPSTLIYLKTDKMLFNIPLGMEGEAYNPIAFKGNEHKIKISVADENELKSNRNISKNPIDRRGETSYYPHCSANVETRGESVFAAKNTIDGVIESSCHGAWPYQSWGDNENPNAEIMIDFGRIIHAEKIVIYIRADFPHDNYWRKVKLLFSDGSIIVKKLIKTAEGQIVSFDEKEIEWVKMMDLEKSDDESLFPALTQWEVYGRD